MHYLDLVLHPLDGKMCAAGALPDSPWQTGQGGQSEGRRRCWDVVLKLHDANKRVVGRQAATSVVSSEEAAVKGAP